MEICDIRENIETIKKQRHLWHEFEYSEPDHDMKRYALAIALQYDQNCQDNYELIKFLMENEVKSRENDPFQGIGDALILLSFLLSKFKDPENVWIYERAKCANFDTYCGYETEFLFSAGVDVTCNYLETSQVTEENQFWYERQGEIRTIFTEEEIAFFVERMEQCYPDSEANESTRTLLCRAIDFNHQAEMERMFKRFEDENKADTDALYYFAKDIKNYDKAIFYKKKILAKATSYWEKVSALHDLANLYCLKTEYGNAFEIAKKWHKILDRFDNWRKTGLGRSLTETWFDISIGLHQQNLLKFSFECFNYGESMIRSIKGVSYNIYQKAHLASTILGKSDKETYYLRLMDEEKERIEAELNG